MDKCLIRVDGNSYIGTGHQMRCMAIASELEKFCKVVFVSADEENSAVLRDKGYEVRLLGSQWNQMDGEVEKFKRVIEEETPEIVLVDSYQVTENYLRELKKKVRVAYIDDLHEFVYPCDVLINYSVYAGKFNYTQEYADTTTKFLLGCKYAPLRQEFKDIKTKNHKERIEKVLVLSGGTDQYHFLLQFVEQIVSNDAFDHILFQVVCGKYNGDKIRLKEIQSERNNLEVYENLTDLKRYMEEADVAISAAGTTLYELAACGTATIAYALADNQIENLKGFSEKDYMISVGDIREGFPEENLIRALQKASELVYRMDVEKKMRNLVDGYGTSYLADEIINLSIMEKEVKDE